ncbi:MAG: alpha/beta hydrolase [Steroidobacteraceae bacterium]|nr:alpha/beta hydrolase [Steroidobacteraceae bacterium]
MTKLLLAFLAFAACTPCAGAESLIEEVRFSSEGVELAGSVVLPAGEIHAGVVFIHGSGKQQRDLHWAHKFAHAGIAALVYDKRGVGKSGGVYEGDKNVSERNLLLLAEDASNALRRLSQHPALRGKPLGFGGISQAGWIAPLAAGKRPLAKFLVLWSGPVCKVSEEDIYSKYTADRDGKFAPPYAAALASRQQKYIWPDFLGRDTDPAEDLTKLSIPGLWIFSDNDTSIPVDLSVSRLQTLRQAGHSYDYVLFSGLGHNNMDGTFNVATDWIRQRK